MSVPAEMGKRGPQVNKFEQVSCGDHQMPVAGGQGGARCPGLMSRGRGRYPDPMSGVGGGYVPRSDA